MQVGFHPSINFKADASSKVLNNADTIKDLAAAPDTLAADDKYNKLETRLSELEAQLSANKTPEKTETPQKKTSLRDMAASLAKFYTNTTELVKGTIKGVVYGAATGIGLLAGGWLFRSKPEGYIKAMKHPMKTLGTKGKILSGLGALAMAGYHLTKARLSANQKTADVDHQLRVDHRAKKA